MDKQDFETEMLFTIDVIAVDNDFYNNLHFPLIYERI